MVDILVLGVADVTPLVVINIFSSLSDSYLGLTVIAHIAPSL